jgi:hypothetical protein
MPNGRRCFQTSLGSKRAFFVQIAEDQALTEYLFLQYFIGKQLLSLISWHRILTWSGN